ncbi:MAG: hypothetical protein AMK73_10105, partial [Planctomycetes bacterium SM23_32]
LAGQAATRPFLEDSRPALGVHEPWHAVMLEVGRALLLVAFVLPVIKMIRGGRLETALTTACLLCVLGGVAGLIMPDPFLPDRARLTFLVERGLANLLYGLLVGYLFSRSPGEAR